MKCAVLAAGYATRLYPLTENFPKPLLEVRGKSILDWLLDDIDRMEQVSEFIIISNHRYYEHFVKWKENCRLTKKVTVLDDGTTDNTNRLGAVKDIVFAMDSLAIEDDLFIIAGDNIIDFSFSAFADYFNKKNASCIMRYHEPDKKVLQRSGVAEMGEDDIVVNMVEKPESPASNWGIPPFYIYKKADLPLIKEGIKAGCGVDAPGSLVEWMCRQTKVYAMEMPGKTYDIGDLESYEQVKQNFLKG